MEKTLYNLTGKDIEYIHDMGELQGRRLYTPIGKAAVVKLTEKEFTDDSGLVKFVRLYPEILHLPEPTEGKMFIVSKKVFDNTDRPDVLTLDYSSTQVEYDSSGNIKAFKRFICK